MDYIKVILGRVFQSVLLFGFFFIGLVVMSLIAGYLFFTYNMMPAFAFIPAWLSVYGLLIVITKKASAFGSDIIDTNTKSLVEGKPAIGWVIFLL